MLGTSDHVSFSLSKSAAIAYCMVLSGSFVGSLYIWRSDKPRDHPGSIKRRIISVTAVSLLAPVLLAKIATPNAGGHALIRWVGFRIAGLLRAVVFPTALTASLFAGPLAQKYFDDELPTYDSVVGSDLVCVRNIVVAPIAEEWVFRGCMMPLLVPCFGARNAILCNPTFFGLAHIHHMIENVRVHKKTIAEAAAISAFQYAYTAIFGMYSAFLFVRTGHIAAPIMSHALCNIMGFPDFGSVQGHKREIVLKVCLVGGLVAFATLSKPLTAPHLYPGNPYT